MPITYRHDEGVLSVASCGNVFVAEGEGHPLNHLDSTGTSRVHAGSDREGRFLKNAMRSGGLNDSRGNVTFLHFILYRFLNFLNFRTFELFLTFFTFTLFKNSLSFENLYFKCVDDTIIQFVNR